jgi:hypothetical protein
MTVVVELEKTLLDILSSGFPPEYLAALAVP